MDQLISAAEANRAFSRLLREVREEGRRFVVTSHGEQVALIGPCSAAEAGRKSAREAAEVRSALLGWSDGFAMIETTPDVIVEAMELVTTHRLSFWDSVMLAAAAQAGCRFLLSEDMQDGFTWRGVTVRNPFSDMPS
jgi:prevent-host-death family protein